MDELDEGVIENVQPGAGDMAQLGRVPAALPEEFGLLPVSTNGSQSSVTPIHGM